MKLTPERFVLVALVIAVAVLGYLYVQRPSSVVRTETRYVPAASGSGYPSDQYFSDLKASVEREKMDRRIDCLQRSWRPPGGC